MLIVSNRLPVKMIQKEGGISYRNSEGGLATGLGSIYKEDGNLWIGWPGDIVADKDKDKVRQDLARDNLHPIFLTAQEIQDYYEGFSNETLWPLFHYFPTYSVYKPEQFDVYKQANQKFADEILKIATEDDVIWIHDYQLMLLPEMIRSKLPGVTIGFFLHIPFPSYEVFRLLPWRKELLTGLSGADVVGFHTYDDVRHFLSATSRILNVNATVNELVIDNRKIVADAFPISIDYKKYRQLAESAETKRNERKLRELTGHNKLVISIDRLDYTKGILNRLQAYKLLLERHPELRGKITLVHLVVPSRDNVARYKELKEEMDKLIGDINGRFSTFSWQPIQHFYRSFNIEILSALYKAADVALVTPLRDGMNLVSKEYVASKIDQKGVLVLSEMAGASRELPEAILVNPSDIWDYAEKIYQALNMPEEEQKQRMASMQQTVSKFDIFNWVKNFIGKLEEVKLQQQELSTRNISSGILQKMGISYHYGHQRLLFLDYDGTLVPFRKQVNEARPDDELLGLLECICNDPRNKVVITSGRDYKTLDNWLGYLPLDIIAEHGAWYKEYEKPWRYRRDLNHEWKQDILNVLDLYTSRTPGSFIEEKSYSLAWHYRKTEAGLGILRSQEILADLRYLAADLGLQVLQGDKVIEIKNISVNKGKAAKRWLEKGDYDFILAIGDDHTDEDTFKAMPEDAITIKVGSSISAATYYLGSYLDVRKLLKEVCVAGSDEQDEHEALLENIY